MAGSFGYTSHIIVPLILLSHCLGTERKCLPRGDTQEAMGRYVLVTHCVPTVELGDGVGGNGEQAKGFCIWLGKGKST